MVDAGPRAHTTRTSWFVSQVTVSTKANLPRSTKDTKILCLCPWRFKTSIRLAEDVAEEFRSFLKRPAMQQPGHDKNIAARNAIGQRLPSAARETTPGPSFRRRQSNPSVRQDGRGSGVLDSRFVALRYSGRQMAVDQARIPQPSVPSRLSVTAFFALTSHRPASWFPSRFGHPVRPAPIGTHWDDWLFVIIATWPIRGMSHLCRRCL